MDGSAFSTDTPFREVHANGINDDRTITGGTQHRNPKHTGWHGLE
jgi:hypothetical protein